MQDRTILVIAPQRKLLVYPYQVAVVVVVAVVVAAKLLLFGLLITSGLILVVVAAAACWTTRYTAVSTNLAHSSLGLSGCRCCYLQLFVGSLWKQRQK